MRRIIFLLVFIGSIITIYNLSTSIYSLWKKQDLLSKAQTDLEEAQKENFKLRKQLEAVQSASYIEEQARTRLFLAKPHEQEIIISELNPKTEKSVAHTLEIPIWRQWWNLFF